MSEIMVFGVSSNLLPQEHLARIHSCRAVVVSGRMRPLLAATDVEQIPIAPVAAMIEAVRAALQQGDVAVLASGDPLFFGIGRTLINAFGAQRLRIYPALSAMQLACARFKVPWDDLCLLSLHGRRLDDAAGRILGRERVMLLTDQHNTPDRIAAMLLQRLQMYNDGERIRKIRVRVAEQLGLPDERLHAGTLAEIAESTFSPLNMMLIEQNTAVPELPVFGLQEKEISHCRGLITKDEVRAVILHCLRLPRQGVLWDVGGGSGSISLEAASLAPELVIHIVERKEEGLATISRNIVRFGRYNIQLTAGEAPAVLETLPDPDRVFIGGSGGQLAGIIRCAAQRLKRGGRLVASAVLVETAGQAPGLMADAGLEVEVRTVAVTRRQHGQQTETRLNTITLISGIK